MPPKKRISNTPASAAESLSGYSSTTPIRVTRHQTQHNPELLSTTALPDRVRRKRTSAEQTSAAAAPAQEAVASTKRQHTQTSDSHGDSSSPLSMTMYTLIEGFQRNIHASYDAHQLDEANSFLNAFEDLETSMKHAGIYNNACRAKFYYHLGCVQSLLGHLEKADKNFRLAVNIYSQLSEKDDINYAQALSHLIIVSTMLDQDAEATIHCHTLIDIYSKNPDETFIKHIDILCHLGRNHLKLNYSIANIRSIWHNLQMILENQNIISNSVRAHISLFEAELLLKDPGVTSNIEKSRETLKEARVLAGCDSLLRGHIYLALAQLSHRVANYKKAHDEAKEAKVIFAANHLSEERVCMQTANAIISHYANVLTSTSAALYPTSSSSEQPKRHRRKSAAIVLASLSDESSSSDTLSESESTTDFTAEPPTHGLR